MTSGKPGSSFWIASMRSKCSDCWPLNLYAPWLVPMATARLSQPDCFDERLRLVGIGQHGVLLIDLDVFFHAAEHAQLRLDRQIPSRGRVRRCAW